MARLNSIGPGLPPGPPLRRAGAGAVILLILLAVTAWALPTPDSWYADTYYPQDVRLVGEPERVGAGICQFHFPHFWAEHGHFYAVYIKSAGLAPTGEIVSEVGLAFSTDGRDFHDTGTLIERDRDFDIHRAAFADIWRTADGVWHVVYEARSYGLGPHDWLDSAFHADGDWTSIAYATSTDLLNWHKHGPILAGGGHFPDHVAQHWASHVVRCPGVGDINVGTPTLYREAGTWHLYFHGYSWDGRLRIYHASGPDLLCLTINPVPLIDVEQDPDVLGGGTCGSRSRIWKRGGLYYMAYEVSTIDDAAAFPRWGITIARAQRPEGPWFKWDRILLENPEPGFGCDGPEWLRVNGQDWLYWRGAGNTTWRQRLVGLPPGEDNI